MLHEGVGSLFEAVEGLSKAEIDGVGLASARLGVAGKFPRRV